jgi:hypothetical protein
MYSVRGLIRLLCSRILDCRMSRALGLSTCTPIVFIASVQHTSQPLLTSSLINSITTLKVSAQL